MKHKVFSNELGAWLKGKQPKTLASLDNVFAEKSIAIAIFLLLFLPSLPLPTGGISHVFELIAMLLALELIIGRTSIWLPKSWRRRSLGGLAEKKVLPSLVRYIRWFEKFSRPRLRGIMQQRNSLRLVGLITLIFTIFAFIAPPFSGLDTLPALGVVILMLSIILEDGLIFCIGCFVGTAGATLTIGLGAAIAEGIKHLF